MFDQPRSDTAKFQNSLDLVTEHFFRKISQCDPWYGSRGLLLLKTLSIVWQKWLAPPERSTLGKVEVGGSPQRGTLGKTEVDGSS